MRTLEIPKICVIILLILLSGASLALAENELLSEEFRACMDAAESPVAMSICLAEETQKQDARLNEAYEDLMRRVSRDEQMALYEAQLAWIKFRGTYSDFLYEHEKGNMGLVTSGYWYVYCTAEQARQLEFLLEDD